ncbi:tenomodulin [Periophthalmus magnuspinnatus]|uniref:tenomodulin n=1 Tax=Periophthalmus magnuspinnatus TaxID=409849 RepID=UPI00145BA1AC|nr:tenomodulin [Periophthalmus magnuspinnatus]
MEACSQSSSQQMLWKDVEGGKHKRFQGYQRLALILATLFLVLALCVISLHYLWSPTPGRVYDQQYKAVVDGVETDSVMEIDPGRRIEIFRMGNGSEEVVEVHDFKHGITGIRFAKHQKCYIRTQSRRLPQVTEMEAEDTQSLAQQAADGAHVEVVQDSRVWVPAEEPIINPAFLFDSKIWEICQELPIHWIHPTPLSDAEMLEVDTPDAEVIGQRVARDVLNHVPVNDYRDVGIELDNRLDDLGYCCQHCRRGYRYCRRYHEPLGGFNPWPYYYQGGRTICQIVMPCNWWIARMLGRI